MAKNRNFNNNIYNKNINGNNAINIKEYDDSIDKEYPELEDKIDIPEIKIETKKEYIKTIFKPLPQNKIYFSNPDINNIITCFVKYSKDLNIFSLECSKLGYTNIEFKQTDKIISFLWDGKRFEYEKCNL